MNHLHLLMENPKTSIINHLHLLMENPNINPKRNIMNHLHLVMENPKTSIMNHLHLVMENPNINPKIIIMNHLHLVIKNPFIHHIIKSLQLNMRNTKLIITGRKNQNLLLYSLATVTKSEASKLVMSSNVPTSPFDTCTKPSGVFYNDSLIVCGGGCAASGTPCYSNYKGCDTWEEMPTMKEYRER